MMSDMFFFKNGRCKNIIEQFPEEILNKYRCHKCFGRGYIQTPSSMNGDIPTVYNYDVDACEVCDGVGYIYDIEGLLKIQGFEFCDECFGAGCKSCLYTGFFDWMEKILKKKKNTIPLHRRIDVNNHNL